MAVPTLSGEVNTDEFFSNGVLLTDVELPSDPNATTGTSTVTIEGSGTVTVGNQRGGGFPRLTVVGGTKIESKRTYDESVFQKLGGTGNLPLPVRLVFRRLLLWNFQKCEPKIHCKW